MNMMTRLPGAGRLPAALGAAAVAAVLWTPVANAATEPGEIADLVERVSPAVVTVLAEPEERAGLRGGAAPMMPGSPFEDFFRRFGMPGMPFPPAPDSRPHGVSLGSGFVIEDEGLIVTNNHVVEGAGTITIRMADDREYTAELVGTDPQTDLALLKIDAEGLPHLDFGDSDRLRVGEDVIAVGNPFGLGGTVTRGIVSAVARDIDHGPYTDYIQTDAAINRGNSGGPLLNLEGEVIGVNTQIYSPNGGSVGVGFAIPSNVVSTVVAQLREHGSVERGWLGVSIQPVTKEIAEALGLDEAKGALVANVVEGSPADGKLRSGDIVLGFGGKPVEEVRDLTKLVAAARPGEKAKLSVLRDGREVTVKVSLGEREDDRRAALGTGGKKAEGTASDRLGATLSALTPALREQMGLGDEAEGVVVTSLRRDGPAAEAGLRVGDVILSVAGKQVASPAEVDSAVADAPAKAILMQIARGDARLFIGVPLA